LLVAELIVGTPEHKQLDHIESPVSASPMEWRVASEVLLVDELVGEIGKRGAHLFDESSSHV